MTRPDAAGEQGQALLGLAGAWRELSEEVRAERAETLHANPVICSQAVLDEAQVHADTHEAAALGSVCA